MDYDAVATNVIMNQLCKVCGEPAAGFHFGAFTCEGCKSFFGRTYNNISSISECKNNGECVINKKNRTACKACRLRKCLLVGMSKSGSRYGRRSNWFKIHCLLQEQQQQQQQQVAGNMAAAANNLLRPHPYLSPLFNPLAMTHQPMNRPSMRDSSSDSGASSADPEDDCQRPASAFSYAGKSSLNSPASDCNFFAGGKTSATVVPRWLPPAPSPSVHKGAAPSIAVTAPDDQEQPIDLSVKSKGAADVELSDHEVSIDVVGHEDAVKATGPLDLTLVDR
ncbi:unnamed protein product [Brassicogethes aeneus]|uniref:Nuclear receptor domain-containing protein n=1 Tax=Brassicogethes aeneus TaxID=1431903 RepID=A0A9P0FAJ6_BRAAE|nr:unnamed protein product [Brassicogethes aeneus]